METMLESLARLIEIKSFAPFVAFVSGVVASFMPCSLSALPLILAYIMGSCEKNGKRALHYCVIFAAGNAVTFTSLALLAVFAGKMFAVYSRAWLIFLGLLMFAMALQCLGLFQFVPQFAFATKNSKKGLLGAFLTGVLTGLFASPCSTPVLIALLSVIATKSNVVLGVVLMLFYALGHSFSAILAGSSLGLLQKIISDNRYKRLAQFLKIATGSSIFLVGIYMFYLAR